MSLSLKATDHLFDRLIATYGRDFFARWEGLEHTAIKSSWSYELAGFSDNLLAIAWALENLPARPPNVIEFRALCRAAPAPEVPRLPEPKADPARLAAELEKLGSLKTTIAAAARADEKDWARRILTRKADGANISPTTLSMAETALQGEINAA